MKKVQKFIAECGLFNNNNNGLFSCSGYLTRAQELALADDLNKMESRYQRCIRNEEKHITQTYKYAMKKVLPVCIKELRRIDDKKANQIADEFKNVVKPIVRTLKKAITLALKHDNKKLSDKFLKILIAVQQYQDINA